MSAGPWRRRCAAACAAAGDWVRRAPITYTWPAVLAVTSSVQRILSPAQLEAVLGRESTNLHNLVHHPFRVLVASLFWIDGIVWFPYLIGFTLTLAIVEHWLGSLRLLAVGLLGHVLATFVSEGILALAISRDTAAESMVRVVDVGVSYFLASVVGVLAYRVARPWRWGFVAGTLIVFAGPVVLKSEPTFTDVGHLSALIIGFCCYPFTVGKARRRSDWVPHIARPAVAP